MTLLSYGVGKDRAWATLSTAKGDPYVEIQGGPLDDQAVKLELQPKETRWHVEFWIPSSKALNIYSLKVPNVKLRAISEVPLFDWAREEEVKVWKDLVRAYKTRKRLPEPPEIHQGLWAPSGMEHMIAAFEWAIQNTNDEKAERWKFYYGTWMAGTGKKKEAIQVLSTSSLGVANALLARLLKLDGDIEGAAKALRSIQEKWLQLHPQIIVERDEVLRNLGTQTLAEREQWLNQVDALQDEWIIERRVQLLVDSGEFQKAKELLLSVSFQKVHQRYTRTALWNQICEKLNEPGLPIPAELGEDQLAAFGAYREFPDLARPGALGPPRRSAELPLPRRAQRRTRSTGTCRRGAPVGGAGRSGGDDAGGPVQPRGRRACCHGRTSPRRAPPQTIRGVQTAADRWPELRPDRRPAGHLREDRGDATRSRPEVPARPDPPSPVTAPHAGRTSAPADGSAVNTCRPTSPAAPRGA